MEILFILIKNDSNIKGIEIFWYHYLYAAYADDTIFSQKTPFSNKGEIVGISV